MAVRRPVRTSFWTDSKVVDNFTPEDKYFFLYLMTNPHTTQLGIYELNVKQAAFELGYSVDTVKYLIERFEKTHKLIKYNNDTKEVAINNFLIHSIIKGGKPVEDCLVKEMKQVKDRELISIIFENLISKEELLNQTVKMIVEGYFKDKDKENNKDNNNDNDNDNERIVPRIVESASEKDVVVEKPLNVYEERFKEFWKHYPKKVGKGKVEQWFIKNKPSQKLLDEMVVAIKEQSRSSQWQEEKGRFIPNPMTWLNQGRWQDELGVEIKTTEDIELEEAIKEWIIDDDK